MFTAQRRDVRWLAGWPAGPQPQAATRRCRGIGQASSTQDTARQTPRDCVEALHRAREMGLDRIGFTIYSLPPEVEARIDYMRMIAEEIVRPVSGLA